MGFLGFGKKKEPEPVNLKDYLSEEEIRLLETELRTVANRVPGETSAVVAGLAESVKNGESLPVKEGLGMCVSALNMTKGFGEAQAGSAELLGKLTEIRKKLTGK